MGHQKITLACHCYCITSTQFGFTPVAEGTKARKALGDAGGGIQILRRLHNEKLDYGPLNPHESSKELLVRAAQFRTGIQGYEGRLRAQAASQARLQPWSCQVRLSPVELQKLTRLLKICREEAHLVWYQAGCRLL